MLMKLTKAELGILLSCVVLTKGYITDEQFQEVSPIYNKLVKLWQQASIDEIIDIVNAKEGDDGG